MLHRSGLLAACILLGTLLPAASEPVDDPGTDAAQVIAAEKAWADAALARDRKVLEELTGQDFSQANWDGSRPIPRSQWLENLLTRLEFQHLEISGHNAQVYGDMAVVTSRFSWEGKLSGKPFAAKGVLMDVWRKRDGRWQAVFRAVG